MTFDLILHGGAPESMAIMGLFGAPIVAGTVAAAVAGVAVVLAGWRAGFAAAAVGALFLGCGLAGDFMSHSEQGHHRHELLHSMMQSPTTTGVNQLMEMDSAEARNVWHFTSAAGQGFLVAGLAGAAFILWRQRRTRDAWEDDVPVPMRQAA
jgi:hypothetical protein